MVRRSVYLLSLCCVLLSVAALNTTPAHGAKNNTSQNDLLKAKNKQIAPLHTLPQWQRVLEDHAFENTIEPSKKYRAWKKFVRSVQNESPVRQLLKVNLWFNGFPYKQDNWVYGEDDYWATPSEFLENGGDCEDYVITKYLTLRQLGFSSKNMKIAMVYDVFSGTDHSLLIVEHDNETYVLDNRENMTVAAHYAKRYKPHYIFNENNLWTYDSPVIARRKSPVGDAIIMPGNR